MGFEIIFRLYSAAHCSDKNLDTKYLAQHTKYSGNLAAE